MGGRGRCATGLAGALLAALALAADPAAANHYCPGGARMSSARVELWRDGKCSGPAVFVPFSGDPNRPDFRAFASGNGSRYDVDNSRSSLAIAPGTCVRLYDGVNYTGEGSNLLCTPPNPEDWGLYAFDDPRSSMRVCADNDQASCGPGPTAPPPSSSSPGSPPPSSPPPPASSPPPASPPPPQPQPSPPPPR